jgi:hypothetical protein
MKFGQSAMAKAGLRLQNTPDPHRSLEWFPS